MKNDRVFILRESVVKITQMLSGKGIRVTQQGVNAYVKADHNGVPVVVNLPYLPDNASEELCGAIQGFLDHEVAHILFTDFPLMGKANAKGRQIGFMLNALEDPRIEKEMAKRFQGSAYNLRVTGRFYLDKFVIPKMKEKAAAGDANGVIQTLMVPMLRAMSGQQVFQEFMKDHWTTVAPVYERIKDLTPRLEGATSTQDCLDLAIEIGKRLSDGGSGSSEGEKSSKSQSKKSSSNKAGKSSKSESKSSGEDADGDESDSGKSDGKGSDGKDGSSKGKPQKSPPKTDDEGEDGEGGKSDEKDDGEKSDKSEEDEKGDKSDKDGEPEKDEGGDDKDGESDGAGEEESEEDEDEDSTTASGEGEDEDEGDVGEADESDDTDASTDAEASTGAPSGSEEEEELGDSAPIWESLDKDGTNGYDESMSRALSESALLAATNSDYMPYTKDHDLIEKLPIGSAYTPHMLRRLTDAVDHMVAPLQKDLERAISARSLATRSHGHRSGKINGAALSRLVFNDDRVFSRKHESTSKDVAVELVVDASGSMSGSKINTASQAAYALSAVLDRLSIKNEVICFTTKDIGNTQREAYETMSKTGIRFSRLEGLYMPILKGFEERMVPSIKERFAWLPNANILRSNVDGECVEIAARRLLARKESGKVMIVLSDGYPAAAGSRGDLEQHLVRVVKDVSAAGVRVVGIGIESNAVQKFYPKSLVLNKVADLPAAVIKELRHLLMV